MATYLLLRDNKESGPFALDELLHFGLKPYDLIWVQGKSAAWRYPSEIDELKPYAPVVEEQPFDRFFKKTSENNVQEQATAPDDDYSRYVPKPAEAPRPSYTPKRSVFVTLPGQQQVALNKDIPKIQTQPAERIEPTPIPAPVIPEQAPTVSVTENPALAEIKYSQPLDDIKEMYVKTLLDRKSKQAKKGMLATYMKQAAVFAGLVIAGVLAGFIIKSNSGTETATGEVKDLLKMPAASTMAANPGASEEPNDQEEGTPAEKITHNATREQPVDNGARDIAEPASYTPDEQAPLKIRKETMMIVPKRKEDYNRQPIPGAIVNSLTGERERRMRNSSDFTSSQKSAKVSLRDMVTVVSNDYKRVAFGGIRNLYLTVTNNSAYELDHVIVELAYLKPSEEPLRTENISFKSIAPNASATVRIPDTNRGIKVNYRIINIETRETIPGSEIE